MNPADFGSLPDRKFLAIQGTSVGLAPHVDDVVIDDKRFYKKVHTGFDLIYSPWETRFMKLVKENGAVQKKNPIRAFYCTQICHGTRRASRAK